MPFQPFKLALWLFVAGISFGLSLGWAWLVLLGLLGPIALFTLYAVWPFFQSSRP
jgi:hypothetical protein